MWELLDVFDISVGSVNFSMTTNGLNIWFLSSFLLTSCHLQIFLEHTHACLFKILTACFKKKVLTAFQRNFKCQCHSNTWKQLLSVLWNISVCPSRLINESKGSVSCRVHQFKAASFVFLGTYQAKVFSRVKREPWSVLLSSKRELKQLVVSSSIALTVLTREKPYSFFRVLKISHW